MKKIALIIATPVFTNSGMHSVDKAGFDLFDSLNIDYDIFCAQNIDREYLCKKIILLRNNDCLKDYSHIIYWGDFINNPLYGSQDFTSRDLKQGFSKTTQDAYSRWLSLFALEGFEKGERKVASFGVNFHFQIGKEYDIEQYKLLIQKNFDFISPRDCYSATNLLRILDDDFKKIVHPGIDCAFLLNSEKKHIKKYCASYFMHRSKIKNAESIIKSSLLKFNLHPEQISNWLSIKNHSEFISNKNKISESLIMITDTYHAAINSINSGTIPLCITKKEISQKGTLGDFKKITLFQTILLEDLLIEIEDNESEELIIKKISDKIKYVIENMEYINNKISYINNSLVNNTMSQIKNIINM